MKTILLCSFFLCSTLALHTTSPTLNNRFMAESAPAQETENDGAYSANKICWGLGPSRNELNQPIDSLMAQEKYGNLNALFLNPEENQILLTFDNGYENGNTASILDTLKKHHIKAIFFVTSQYVIENPDLIERMIEEGHVIGNHSWHHKSFPDCSAEELKEEIMMLHNYMIEHHQYNMTILRPPMGEFSEQSLAIAKELGYTTMLWSYAYYDYNVNDQPDHAEAFNKLISHLHPGEILLLHAVSTTNMEIMDEFLVQTLSQGYQFTDPTSIQNKDGALLDSIFVF